MYFKPTKEQLAYIRQSILGRMEISSFTRWIMVVCARVFESSSKGDDSQNQTYQRWIEDVQFALRSALAQNPISPEARVRSGEWLEVGYYLKHLAYCAHAKRRFQF